MDLIACFKRQCTGFLKEQRGYERMDVPSTLNKREATSCFGLSLDG
jgi:hypothetical protein